MSTFEYVMVLVSIIVALAIAHLLTAVADTVHRLRGQGQPIKLDAVFSIWTGYVLIWLVSFWWWEFKFQEVVTNWTFGLYLFVIGYAIVLFMLAAILVPHRMQGVTDTYVYFVKGRRWFFGTYLFANAIDVFDTFFKSYEWGMRPAVWINYSVIIAVAIAAFITERRSIQLGAAVVAFSAQLIYLFQELGVLGSW
ncbi:MAG: hypothetical protein OEO18_20895 [Gammaproteobacteria bacterium]|nr:hypothetical protein [Gammaproteobacteria bacterium]